MERRIENGYLEPPLHADQRPAPSLPAVWPDAALEREMRADAEELRIFPALVGVLGRGSDHIRSLIDRVRELEAELARN